ncbi:MULTISPECIES: IclR family transcriptional regulator [Streptomyces]|uniref:Glycerol operon regulatory protein n=2 Tax=Streptomyces TaxID=1883 RepID=D7C5Y4_STRBB|nr:MULTISPECIES: IclR family transcriptional regulator [Streptomyces]ADI12513.1 IclR family transcriptional regulator [Streptomyces bingchenggensis BCW-1]MDT0543713.1 IclR family transcriptional regulator [Streptomyces sp. DSM 41529]
MESVTDAAGVRKVEEVKSAARVLEVLELLGRDGARLSLAEMASAMAVPKSSLHAILRTMQARRWVDVDPSGTRYSLGLKALLTGTAYLAGDDVASLAGPVLDALAEETGEAVHLGRLDGTHVVHLAKRESRHALRTYSAVGYRLPAHATALGKAVLSQLDQAEVQRRLTWPLEKLTPDTVVDPDAFLAELAEARLRGWAMDDGENAVDIRSVAVPLGVSPDGGDAVSCSAPRSRMGDDRIEEVAQAVTEAAHSLSMLLKRLGQH